MNSKNALESMLDLIEQELKKKDTEDSQLQLKDYVKN